MKTYKYMMIAFAALIAGGIDSVKAQISPDTYYNVDWQFNIPLGNNYANVASGWGMNFEGGYYVTPEIAVGGFLSYHTNNEYFGARELPIGTTGTLYTDQQHAFFQLPFGVSGRYRFDYDKFHPYVGFRLGAEYAQMKTYYNIYEETKNTWGFYMQPELGVNFYPWPQSIGFHAAVYYSFSTNKGSLLDYDVDSANNFGIRLGVAF